MLAKSRLPHPDPLQGNRIGPWRAPMKARLPPRERSKQTRQRPFRSVRRRYHDASIAGDIERLRNWHAELDAELEAALESLSQNDAARTIARDGERPMNWFKEALTRRTIARDGERVPWISRGSAAALLDRRRAQGGRADGATLLASAGGEG